MAQIQIYADLKLKEAIEQVAREEERSVSYVVRQWIKQGLALRTQIPAGSQELEGGTLQPSNR